MRTFGSAHTRSPSIFSLRACNTLNTAQLAVHFHPHIHNHYGSHLANFHRHSSYARGDTSLPTPYSATLTTLHQTQHCDHTCQPQKSQSISRMNTHLSCIMAPQGRRLRVLSAHIVSAHTDLRHTTKSTSTSQSASTNDTLSL